MKTTTKQLAALVRAVLADFGARGGRSKTERKRKASRANAAKARAVLAKRREAK